MPAKSSASNGDTIEDNLKKIIEAWMQFGGGGGGGGPPMEFCIFNHPPMNPEAEDVPELIEMPELEEDV